MFGVWPAGRYLRMFHIRQYILFIHLVRNGSFLTPFVPTSQFSINVSVYTICLQLMCASEGLTSWIVSESHSYINLNSLYMLKKVSISLWPLIDVQTLPSLFIYLSGSTMYLWYWLAILRDFQSGNYIVWTFITSIYLKLGLRTYYTHSYRKSTKFAIIIALFCIV